MKKILILGTNSLSTRIIYNYLEKEFTDITVIIENKIPPSRFFKIRLKKVGILRLFDQILFLTLIQPFLNVLFSKRKKEIISKYEFLTEEIDSKVFYVESVNHKETIERICALSTDIIILSGTRILSQNLLKRIKQPIINIHAGITPEFRGVHGAYWALIKDLPNLCGVTMHFVDKGVDTGNIIKQELIEIGKKDSIVTYPLIQLGVGCRLLKELLRVDGQNLMEHVESFKDPVRTPAFSKQWYHPGFIEYFLNFLIHGVK